MRIVRGLSVLRGFHISWRFPTGFFLLVFPSRNECGPFSVPIFVSSSVKRCYKGESSFLLEPTVFFLEWKEISRSPLDKDLFSAAGKLPSEKKVVFHGSKIAVSRVEE